VIEPIFDRTFIFDSYGCRLGKGTHMAVDRYQKFCRSHAYVLKFDLKKFFPNIDHQLLENQLSGKIKDGKVMELIRKIIAKSDEPVGNKFYEQYVRAPVDYIPGDHLFTPHWRKRGLPIGNLTSQFFANVYLNGLDHFIKEELQCKAYIRYVDDMVIFSDDKSWLWELRDLIAAYLYQLRMTIHPQKCWIYRTGDGVDFLGYQVFPAHRRLRRASAVRFSRRLKQLQWDYKAGRIDIHDVQQPLAGWFGHASHADTWGLKRSLLSGAVFRRG
jgi:retron-type reverse transcriptase